MGEFQPQRSCKKSSNKKKKECNSQKVNGMSPSTGIKREEKSECIVLSQDRMTDSGCVFVAITIDSLNQTMIRNPLQPSMYRISLEEKYIYLKKFVQKFFKKDTTFKKSFKLVKHCLKTLDMKIMSKHITFS